MPTCLADLRVLHLHLEGVSEYSPLLSNILFFSGPNLRDLQSEKLSYHYNIKIMDRIPISFDALAIIFHDSPFVKGSLTLPDRFETNIYVS